MQSTKACSHQMFIEWHEKRSWKTNKTIHTHTHNKRKANDEKCWNSILLNNILHLSRERNIGSVVFFHSVFVSNGISKLASLIDVTQEKSFVRTKRVEKSCQWKMNVKEPIDLYVHQTRHFLFYGIDFIKI